VSQMPPTTLHPEGQVRTPGEVGVHLRLRDHEQEALFAFPKLSPGHDVQTSEREMNLIADL
jgi:hypothetical protein